jgi:protein-arginine kinase activator protein McsA
LSENIVDSMVCDKCEQPNPHLYVMDLKLTKGKTRKLLICGKCLKVKTKRLNSSPLIAHL